MRVREAVLDGFLDGFLSILMERPLRPLPSVTLRPVASHWADPQRWVLQWAGKWRFTEHINILRTRTISELARHLSRSWHQRIMIFSDSQVAMGVIRRMRSPSCQLLMLARKLAAVSLAFHIRFVMRWIPIHMNPADGPSRGEFVGAAMETAAKHEDDGLFRVFAATFERDAPPDSFRTDVEAHL